MIESAACAIDTRGVGVFTAPRQKNPAVTEVDNSGIALGMLGRFAVAEATFTEGLGRDDLGPRVRVALLVDCAEVLIHAGRLTAASDLLARADETATQDLVDQRGCVACATGRMR